MPRWYVEVRRTTTVRLELDASNPAQRDALAHGVLYLMEHGKNVPTDVAVVAPPISSEWKVHQCGELR